jgi:hypothetical protein
LAFNNLITDRISQLAGFSIFILISRQKETYKQRMRTDNVSDVSGAEKVTSPRRRTSLMPPARPVSAIGTYFLDMPRTLNDLASPYLRHSRAIGMITWIITQKD